MLVASSTGVGGEGEEAMATTFGLVMMALLVLLAVVGLVLYVRQVHARKARRDPAPRPTTSEAPFGAESAAGHQAQRFQGPGA